MKRCFVCKKRKALSEFYSGAHMADGHLNKCKECVKAYTNARRLDLFEREKVLASDIRRSKKPEWKAHQLDAQRRRRARNPEKNKARQIINHGIQNGKIIRQPCEICGEKAQAHHSDYSQPLAVRWLCFKHHRETQHHQKVGK